MGAATAFTPSSVYQSRIESVQMSAEDPAETSEPAVDVPAASAPGADDVTLNDITPALALINGWQPDATKPCYGLPGAIAPFGYFDPLGFCKERELGGVKRFREAEIMHGRVAVSRLFG